MSSCFLGLPFPITIIPAGPLTDDELIRFSEANKPCKIERNRKGEIVVMIPVGGVGSTNEMHVSSALYAWNEAIVTGVAFSPNAGFNLPDGSCLSPDAAWLSIERWDSLTLKQQVGYPPLCPEFVIEVRSQSDGRRAVEEKMELWLENGAELAWLIDPIAGNVTIYQPEEPPQTMQRPDVILGSGPVEGFTLRATRLWSGLVT